MAEENLEDVWGDALKEQSTTAVNNWGDDHIVKNPPEPDPMQISAEAASPVVPPAGTEASAGDSSMSGNGNSSGGGGGESGSSSGSGNGSGNGGGEQKSKVRSTLKLLDLKNSDARKLINDIKVGDEALNRLKIQNIDFILGVPLHVSIVLGRTSVLINELLQLGQGSVLELDKMAGEPLEILVNGQLVARGEVVVVNDKFGVRITDIISPVERIERLR